MSDRRAWSAARAFCCAFGQGALRAGSSVTLNLYPEGTTTGDTYYTGTATITEMGVAVNDGDTINRTFSFKGNGPLSESAVS